MKKSLEEAIAETKELNLAININCIMTLSRLIKAGDQTAISFKEVDLYEKALKEYIGMDPFHWVSVEFPDVAKVLNAFSTIKDYYEQTTVDSLRRLMTVYDLIKKGFLPIFAYEELEIFRRGVINFLRLDVKHAINEEFNNSELIVQIYRRVEKYYRVESHLKRM